MHGIVGQTMLRGRWGSERACRIYINAALADLSYYSLGDEHRRKLEQFTNLLFTFAHSINASSLPPGKQVYTPDEAPQTGGERKTLSVQPGR